MRNLDTLPAWASRQRNRLLVRHSDSKIVRWINHRPLSKASSDGVCPDKSDGRTESSSNDNLAAFDIGRAAQAH